METGSSKRILKFFKTIQKRNNEVNIESLE